MRRANNCQLEGRESVKVSSPAPCAHSNTDTIYNPNRLSGGGLVKIGAELFIAFDLTLASVPTPPQPTLCSLADVGKVEWVVGECCWWRVRGGTR